MHWNHFFSSVSKDGEDGNGLKLEKNGNFFQVWARCILKIAKNFVWVVSLLKLIWSFLFGLSGMLLLVSVSTKFQFPVSYDLKNAKLPWQCPFKQLLQRRKSGLGNLRPFISKLISVWNWSSTFNNCFIFVVVFVLRNKARSAKVHGWPGDSAFWLVRFISNSFPFMVKLTPRAQLFFVYGAQEKTQKIRRFHDFIANIWQPLSCSYPHPLKHSCDSLF